MYYAVTDMVNRGNARTSGLMGLDAIMAKCESMRDGGHIFPIYIFEVGTDVLHMVIWPK